MINIIYIILFHISINLSQNLSAYEIVEAMNKKDKPIDVKATFTMESFKDESNKRITEFISWTKDNGNKQIMWFVKPSEYKNMAFLKIHDGIDTKMTMWYPRYKKNRKISSKNKGDSFMSSDLIYEDLYTRNILDFSYELLEDEIFNSVDCYIILSKPNDNIESSYSKHHTWIAKKELLPLKEVSYDKESLPYKKKEFHYIFKDNKKILNLLKIENLNEKHYTNIYINNIQIDSGIGDNIFKENRLKRRPQ